jgi:hypothetical protein
MADWRIALRRSTCRVGRKPKGYQKVRMKAVQALILIHSLHTLVSGPIGAARGSISQMH